MKRQEKIPQIPKRFSKEMLLMWQQASAIEPEVRGMGRYQDFIVSLQQSPEHGFLLMKIRDVSSVKTELEQLLDVSKPVPWSDGYAISSIDYNYWRKSELYRQGYIYFQDPAAMLPAALLKVEPGELVVDCCASPGGKSLALSQYLANDGLLLANEYSTKRLPALLNNLEQAGAANIIVSNNDLRDLVSAAAYSFDRVMLDVPCSGSAMFRKNNFARINWKNLNHRQLQELQYELLCRGAELLKPGGRLVYSTCSFSLSENEIQIARFLKENSDFQLVEDSSIKAFTADGIPLPDCPELRKCYRLYPHQQVGEGHFAAVLTHKLRASQRSDTRDSQVQYYRLGHQLFILLTTSDEARQLVTKLQNGLKIRRMGILTGFAEAREDYCPLQISSSEYESLKTTPATSYERLDMLKLQIEKIVRS